MSNTPTEFYRKYRPRRFSDMIGQEEAVKTLSEMVKNNRVPHALLFVGPSGSGKTTIARILRGKLKCGDLDYFEYNAAKERGIDDIRNVHRMTQVNPMRESRIFLWDEGHHLSKREGGDAQTALLKMLEDIPSKIYYFICTTHPDGLLKTIRTRCTEIRLKQLESEDLIKIIDSVLIREKKEIKLSVKEHVAASSEGSARKALVLLNQVIGLDSEEEMLAAIQPPETNKVAFDLVKALLWQQVKWPQIAAIIRDIKETDWEGIRRLILANAANELIKEKGNHGRANSIICSFEGDFFASGKAGLIRACYEVFSNK